MSWIYCGDAYGSLWGVKCDKCRTELKLSDDGIPIKSVSKNWNRFNNYWEKERNNHICRKCLKEQSNGAENKD